MGGHRSSGRQGKAAMAGTKDKLAAHRQYMLDLLLIRRKYGAPDLPYVVDQLRQMGVDLPD